MQKRLLLTEIDEQIAKLAERTGPLKQPVHAYIAGGTAITYHTGARMSDDVDIQWSRRVAIPPDLQVFPVHHPDDPQQVYLVTMDGGFGDFLGSFHPDWKDDAPMIARHGDIILHMITALDLAVSKLGRFIEQDRADIEALAADGLLVSTELQARGMEAIDYFVGDTTFIVHNLRDAVEIVKKYEAEDCEPH